MRSYRLDVIRSPGVAGDKLVRHGTAWLVTANVVVTAFHVVGDRDENPRDWLSAVDNEVHYRLVVDDKALELEPVACDREADIALLQLPTSETAHVAFKPPSVGEWGAGVGSKWSAPGYAEVAGGTILTLTGEVTGFTPGSPQGVIELRVAQGSGVSWMGTSGSPVCVDGQVVGIMTTEVQGASTAWASEVESAVRLLRVYEATDIHDECVEVLSRQLASPKPMQWLRAVETALAMKLPPEPGDAAELASAIVSRAKRFGAHGISAMLACLDSDEQIAALGKKLVLVALRPERNRWPRVSATSDETRDRHSDWKVPHRLRKAWTCFLEERRWDEQIGGLLQEVKSSLTQTGTDRDLMQKFERFDMSRTYRTIREELRQLVERAQREPARVGSKGRAVEERGRMLSELRRLVAPTTPRGRGFFLMGSSGSGKTHFLEVVLGEPATLPTSSLVLPVDLSGAVPLTPKSVKEVILAALGHATGRFFRDFVEFQKTLDALAASRVDFLARAKLAAPEDARVPRVVIAIDDLHRLLTTDDAAERLCRILESLIEECTPLGAMFWLLTLPEALLDRINSPSQPPSFWEEYGWVGGYGEQTEGAKRDEVIVPAKSGWIDLDRIDEADEVGVEILRRSLGAEQVNAALLSAANGGRQPGVLRYLQLPWFAWTLQEHDAAESLRAIQTGDLHYIDIVGKLWAARLGTIGASRHARRVTERYARCLAAALVRGDGRRWRDEDLTRDVNAAATAAHWEFDIEVFRSQVARLIEASLLRVPPAGQRQLRDGLEVNLEMLWSYEGAEYLCERLADPTDALAFGRIEEMLSTDQRDEFGLKEGVLEFLLMLADQDTAHPDLVKGLVQHLGDSDRLNPAAIWFAAPKASERLQRAVCNDDRLQCRQAGTLRANRRLLFARLMFADRASPEVLGPKERLEFLRAEYEAIYENGFATYYYAVVVRIIEEAQSFEILRGCMVALQGCERVHADLAEHLADRAVDRLFELATDADGREPPSEDLLDKVLSEMFAYLEEVVAGAAPNSSPTVGVGATGARPGAPIATDVPEDEKGFREFFREWVLCAFCMRLVHTMGPVKTYRFLKDRDWSNRNRFGRPVAREMAREATIAIGSFFHLRGRLIEEGRGEGQAFLDLVGELVAGTSSDREEAFYLLRHTVPTFGKWRVSISAKLFPFLRGLVKDRQLLRKGMFRELYLHNIGPLPFLARKRRS